MRVRVTQRALVESLAAALGGYFVAAALEAGVIGWLQPNEWELAWISDLALAMAFGVAVYLWRNLLAARSELGLSQTQVAARMGTSQSAVARLESGDADVRLSTLERYAAALGHGEG